MKKVAVIWSSPNTDGLTATVKNEFAAGLEDSGVQVVDIHLNRKKIERCMACGDGGGTCRTKGECVIRADFEDIYKTLADADGIVWASDVSWWEMTETFKAFFDRLRRCEGMKNHYLADKRCVIIACAGGTGRGVVDCLQQFERGLTHMRMRVYDRIGVVRYNRDYMLPAMRPAGRRYAEALENGFDMYY